MKKNIPFIILGIVIIGILFLLFYTDSTRHQPQQYDTQNSTRDNNEPVSKIITAEKIEIVHFHATQQCWSCVTVGEYALNTIMERFPQQYQNGTITYRDINIDLPENKDLVMKYGARGSSLFINAIDDEQDNIMEDVTVWRLVSNETQFVDYFEKKIRNLLVQ